jgi:hypothetical protein
LEDLSQAAFQIIKVVELERSGIRDGDGYWHGGDVMGGLTCHVTAAHQRWMKAEAASRPAPTDAELWARYEIRNGPARIKGD